MWTNLLICLSLANLIFLRSWQELFRLRTEMPQDLRSDPVTALFAGAIANVVILGLLLWAAITLVDRLRSRALLTLGRCVFLLLLVTPLDFLCRDICTHLRTSIPDPLLRGVWTIIILIPIFGCAMLLAWRNPAVLRVARTIVLIVAPILPLAAANFAWSIYQTPAKPEAPALADPIAQTPERRFLWLVFDEMDQRITFDVRPESIRMPELDRLRATSLFATHAKPPAMYTLESMPSLVTGDLVAKSYWDAGDLRLELADGGSSSLADAGNAFADAREAGFNTGIVGWWLPYCEALPASLTACATPAVDEMRPSSLTGSMTHQLGDHLDLHWFRTRLRQENHWTMRRDLLRSYQVVHQRAFPMITDASLGLVLVHWPIPHPLGIYDRHTDDFAFSRANNYLDNHELLDRVLGETRRALEQANLWEKTSILITSDHPLRPDEWNQHATWTEEESTLSQDRRFPYVPFLLKLAGDTEPVTHAPEFNTVLTRSLIRDFLRGHLTTHEEVEAWLSLKNRQAMQSTE